MATAEGTGIESTMGTSSRCWILVATASTLDTTLAAGSGTIDVANAMGTSRRGPPMPWGTPSMPWGPPAGGSGQV
jgi:hypothetical protein